MLYVTDAAERVRAKTPHHIYNVNIILTHLAISQVALEIGHGNPLPFLLVPIISIMVLVFIKNQSKVKAQKDTWFVAANWTLAWRRGRILIGAYIVAIVVSGLVSLFGSIMGGGLMMNDFSTDGSSTPIHEKISMFFSAVIVFVAVLITFLQTGISTYEAGKGAIDPKIIQYCERGDNANPQAEQQTENQTPNSGQS